MPSSTRVDAGIGKLGGNIANAKKYNDVAVVHNANASSRIQRIEAKAGVIKDYWGK